MNCLKLYQNVSSTYCRHISTTSCLEHLQKMSRVKVVDNSMIGRQSVIKGKRPRIIHVYTSKKPQVGLLGDRVLIAIMGEKKHAYIVGCVEKQKANVPRFDTNNVVLVEDTGIPTGTRVLVPIPSCLRGKEGDFTKILSIATKFV
ncbi:39S ribosomal protein L14 [Mactra antiquata]